MLSALDTQFDLAYGISLAAIFELKLVKKCSNITNCICERSCWKQEEKKTSNCIEKVALLSFHWYLLWSAVISYTQLKPHNSIDVFLKSSNQTKENPIEKKELHCTETTQFFSLMLHFCWIWKFSLKRCMTQTHEAKTIVIIPYISKWNWSVFVCRLLLREWKQQTVKLNRMKPIVRIG